MNQIKIKGQNRLLAKPNNCYKQLSTILTIILLTVFLQSCNAAEKTTDKANTTKAVTKTTKLTNQSKGSKMTILKNKPMYYLRVSKGLATFLFNFNGETISDSFNKYNSAATDYFINDFITSGKNTFSITTFVEPEDNFIIDKEAVATAQIILKTPYKKEVVIAEINYENNQATSPMVGIYWVPEDEKADKIIKTDKKNYADDVVVKLSKLQIIQRTSYQAGKVVGITARQTVELQTPFPRWAYLDGEDIMQGAGEFFYIKGLGFENHKPTPKYYELKNRPEIQELFDICDGMVAKLDKMDIKGFVDMFELRNKEMDRATYNSAGSSAKRLFESLKTNLTDGNFKLDTGACRKQPMLISDTGKTIQIDGSIWLNGIGRNAGLLNTWYHVKFSRINGKWVITK